MKHTRILAILLLACIVTIPAFAGSTTGWSLSVGYNVQHDAISGANISLMLPAQSGRYFPSRIGLIVAGTFTDSYDYLSNLDDPGYRLKYGAGLVLELMPYQVGKFSVNVDVRGLICRMDEQHKSVLLYPPESPGDADYRYEINGSTELIVEPALSLEYRITPVLGISFSAGAQFGTYRSGYRDGAPGLIYGAGLRWTI